MINLSDAVAQLSPSVSVLEADGVTKAVVLVLGGGKADSFAPSELRQLSAIRMRPFASLIHRRGRRLGVAVWTVHYRVQGWNGADRSPVADVEWALAEVRRRHGGVPVVLVGHSMGGRTALTVGGDPSVVGICGLAPWTEPKDPYEQLAGKTLLIVHGSLDMVTSPKGSRRYAVKARRAGATIGYLSIRGEMHAMVYRYRYWHQLAAGFTLGVLGLAPMPKKIQRALDAGVPPEA